MICLTFANTCAPQAPFKVKYYHHSRKSQQVPIPAAREHPWFWYFSYHRLFCCCFPRTLSKWDWINHILTPATRQNSSEIHRVIDDRNTVISFLTAGFHSIAVLIAQPFSYWWVLVLANLCQLDTSWTYLKGGSLNWEIRSAVRHFS